MARHHVYQISKTNKALASQSVFYGLSDAFTQANARKAFVEGSYAKNADIEANSLNEVKSLVNTNRMSSKIVISGALRNIGVGDIIFNEESGLYFIVSPTGYDRIKIK